MYKESALSDSIYSAVKAFALKGTLLPISTLETLAESKDLEDFAARLKGTLYSGAISKLTKPLYATKFELAFREHLVAVHHAIGTVAAYPDLVWAYYLKYPSSNLKTVLKGKALGKTFEELSSHLDLYAEELVGRRDLLVRALSASTLDEAVGVLGATEFGTEASEALRVFKEKGNVQVFDLYLDRAFLKNLSDVYSSLRRSERFAYDVKKVESLVALDIDSYNLLAVLRGKLWELPASDIKGLIIEPTFEVSRRKLEMMIDTSSVQDASRQISLAAYNMESLGERSDNELINTLEEGLRLAGYERAYRPFIWDVFGIGVVLGLIRLKELEVRNLSGIAVGIEKGFSAAEIIAKIVRLRAS